jgi:hypothetical protein
MPIRSKTSGDDFGKAFLGGGTTPPERHDGQKANEKKLAAGQERMLRAEACNFGDDLVRYVAMHQDNTHEELAWGFCLALYVARSIYPNGEEDFDEISDQAANDLVLSEENITEKAEVAPFSDGTFRRAAEFAELMQEYIRRKKPQTGISNRQGAYGLCRAFHNLRRTFPADKGGSAAFDELARRAGEYFAENRET